MTTTKLKSPPKLVTTKEEYKFWHSNDKRNLIIFYKLLEGKTAEEITQEQNLFPDTIPKLMMNDTFKQAIEVTLNSRIMALQIMKIADQAAIYKRLGQEYSARLEKATDDVVVKEFLKMAFAKVDKMEINTNFIKILNQTVKVAVEDGQLSSDTAREVHKYFDISSAPAINEPADSSDNTVVVREEVADEQGEPDRIQRSQVSMGIPDRPVGQDSSS
jgi:predicted hydrocarbon binding protein